MIYSTCPTCGFFIGNVINEFEEAKNKICSTHNITDEEQQEEISKVLKKLKIRRYCCRMRIMSCKDMVQEILPISLK